MASFCEGCPDRGKCVGPIESLGVLSSITQGAISADRSFAVISVERGVPQGPTDVTVRYADGEGGNSKPILLHGNSGTDAENRAIERFDLIDQCTGPSEVKKFLGLVTKRVCGVSQA